MIVSIDHSPSEQITNNHDYYTSVIIASMSNNSGLPHDLLANRIYEEITRCSKNNVKPRKWTGSSKKYKENFINLFFNLISNYSDVYIFALTASKEAILKLQDHYIRELLLDGVFIKNNNKYNFALNGGKVLTLSENRFQYFVHFTNFFLKTYLNCIEFTNPYERWCVYADKFAGDETTENLINITLLNYLKNHIILWGCFKESDTVEIDILADNIAGMLKDIHNNKEMFAKYSKHFSNINWKILD